MRTVPLITAGLVAVALAAGTASAAGKSGFFKTADNSIWCGYSYAARDYGYVVCGIKGGYLKPKPNNNCKKFHDDYVGNRIGFGWKSKAEVEACAGDAGPFANPKATRVLKPGKTWRGSGMSCRVTKSSATCRNRVHHGFTISRAGYKLF
jgi:hypothetical protein